MVRLPQGREWVAWFVVIGLGFTSLHAVTYPDDPWEGPGFSLWFVSIFPIVYRLSWWTYARGWILTLIWAPVSLVIAAGLLLIVTAPEWFGLAGAAIFNPALLVCACVFQGVMRAIHLRWHVRPDLSKV